MDIVSLDATRSHENVNSTLGSVFSGIAWRSMKGHAVYLSRQDTEVVRRVSTTAKGENSVRF